MAGDRDRPFDSGHSIWPWALAHLVSSPSWRVFRASLGARQDSTHTGVKSNATGSARGAPQLDRQTPVGVRAARRQQMAGWAILASLVLISCSPSEPMVDGPSSVSILSPQPDETVRQDVVEVQYHLVRGRTDGGDHVHVWIDGQNEGFSLESPKRLRGVSSGAHTIRVRVATRGHRFPGPESSVDFFKE